MKQKFAIIGIGRFGLAVATELLEKGMDVLAIDKEDQQLRPLSDSRADLVVCEDNSKDSLEGAGVAECDVAIIGIGKDIESSILAALNCKELGVGKIICKAISDDHAKILSMLGAEVVYPEVEVGRRLALTLSSRTAEEVLPLSEDFSIIQIKVPVEMSGKTIVEVNFRKRYGVNVIAIIIEGKAHGTIGPETILNEGDILVIAGSNTALDNLQKNI